MTDEDEDDRCKDGLSEIGSRAVAGRRPAFTLARRTAMIETSAREPGQIAQPRRGSELLLGVPARDFACEIPVQDPLKKG
jgi:hypothetical protein